MENLLLWSRGPFFRFAFAIMVLGLLRHGVLVSASIIKAIMRASDRNIPYKTVLKATFSWLFPINKLQDEAFYSVTSILFHVGIVLVPLFYASHIILWERGIGLSWIALPRITADLLTLLTILTATVLFLVRIVDRDVRVLSRFQDFVLLPLIIIPFISGFFASHPVFSPINYDSLILIHVISADILMLLIPFTKMSHVILLPSTQLVSEVGWHFPGNIDERLTVALQKENEKI